jgi:hypothetical protein
MDFVLLLGHLKKFKNELLGPVYWRRDALRFQRTLARWKETPSLPGVGEGHRVGVLVIPWLLTRAPWFAIALGLLLARKGARVTFIVDDAMFGNSTRDFKLALESINEALQLLESDYEVLRLSGYRKDGTAPECLPPFPESRVAELANLNTIWFMRGDTKNSGRRVYQELVTDQLRESAPRISALLSANPGFEYLLVPGGIYASSGTWLQLAKERGIRVATHDSGPDCVLISTDGIAAQLQDVPRAFEAIQAEPGSVDSAVAEAQAERHRRQQGRDKFGYQAGNTESCDVGADGAILIPLNSPWDSAALGLHAVFGTSIEWVIETVRWALDNTNSSVIVRQHPGERIKEDASDDDYEAALRQSFGDHPRVRFVAAASPINTYALLDKVKVVVAHTSTVGIEAATMGKIVITAARSYYSNLGFVFAATSRIEYFDMLRRALDGQFSLDGSQIRAAWCCYYLAQCCNWVFSDFTPFAFPKWAAMGIDTLYRDSAVEKIITAIDENVPVALIRHRRKQLECAETTGR